MTCHELDIEAFSITNGEMDPMRSGSLHPFVGAYGVYPVAGSHVIICAANDSQWASLCRAMGRHDLVGDERYATAVARTEHRDEVNAMITAWLATLASRDQAVAALGAERVPAAPVLSVAEAVVHPHMRYTGVVRPVTDDRIGEFLVPGPPFRFSEFPDTLALFAGDLGGDNEEVLTGIGGLSPERYDELVAAGVLVGPVRATTD